MYSHPLIRTRYHFSLFVTLAIVNLVLVANLVADQNVALLSSSCQNQAGGGAARTCTWGNATGCRLGATSYFASPWSCSSTRCASYSDNSGCTYQNCCLTNTTVNDACTAFTGPIQVETTTCIKPPPDKCTPLVCR